MAIGAVAAAVVLVMVGVGTGLFHPNEGRSLPTFPSLAAQPDSSLHGSVAYYASDTGCIRLVAAAGQPSRTVWCLPSEPTSTWQKLGKPAGPQLVWRPDGRLEVTMFRMVPPAAGAKGPPALNPGWQKVINVRTGKVRDVPVPQVPATPNAGTQPSVSPGGERIGYSLDESTGRAKVTLTDSTGTRTLLSVRGPGEYGYRFGPVFWAPNWQWIAASDDGRILVITPGNPSLTRVLVTGSGGGAGGGEAGPAFAVTSTDLL